MREDLVVVDGDSSIDSNSLGDGDTSRCPLDQVAKLA